MRKLQTGKKKTGRVVIVIALLLAAILMLSIQITEITVNGNERYTEEQIIELIFPDQQDRNTAYCYFMDRFQEHKQIPFVEDYTIVFNGLNDVEIIVYEKSVVGYVSYMSSYMYFDKDGIIVESANRRVDGIPWVVGLKFGQIALYRPLPVENEQIFGEILNLTQILSIYKLEVDKIQYDAFGEAVLYLDDIEVIIGSNEGLNGKIAELSDMLPELAGRSGTLHLETYDETNPNAMYVFNPR